MIKQERIRKLNNHEYTGGPVVYWMNRDQRAEDNWALLYAQELALQHKVPLLVVFNLVPNFLGGVARQHEFKVRGLEETANALAKKCIPFFLLIDESGKKTADQILAYLREVGAGILVTDFSPLRISRAWAEELRKKITVPMIEVDAHNIVPCWVASDKLEYGAYTLRPKLHRLLPQYLEEFPALKSHPHRFEGNVYRINWSDVLAKVTGEGVSPLVVTPGSSAANQSLKKFISHTLPEYALRRNDPNDEHQSDLSPYMHYGQIAPQRVALMVVKKAGLPISELLYKEKNAAKADTKKELSFADNAGAFLEELIVRRELSDNFCFYNLSYDSTEGFPDWAKKSHERHKGDAREYMYTKTQFERAKTHDVLWNACQNQLLATGKMHGYMRMYWAKKILEWTPSVEKAMDICIYLNDTYELDGRDPNGYAGIAWSLGGTHDRAWFERAVFGQIRYMNRNGCAAKFSVDKYIQKWNDTQSA